MLQRHRNRTTKFALGLALVLCWSGQSIAAPGGNGGNNVTPGETLGGDLATITGAEPVSRAENSSNSTMPYVVLHEFGAIKFEDATVGLGENGTEQTDTFVITADNGGNRVEVIVKASTASDVVTLNLDPDNTILATGDALGFDVTASINDDGDYIITISSDADTAHALSHTTITIAAAPSPPTSDEFGFD